MDEEFEKLIHKLNNFVLDEDFISVAYEVTNQLAESKNAIDSVELILKLLENNPDIDYGSPGPLVHFVEKFYNNGYEEKLVESLERNPTKHTVWMLKRIINSCSGKRKKYFIKILKDIIEYPKLEENVVSCAQNFDLCK